MKFEDSEVIIEGCDCGVILGVETALAEMTIGETSRLKTHPKYAKAMMHLIFHLIC